MSKVQMLRALVKQRLTAAAEEIFGLFERTIAEYEEELSRSKEENERQRKLLDAVFSPQLRLHRADVQQQLVVKEEVPPEQQEWSSSLDQEDPEPPHIKEEQEELWTSQEGEQLQGLEEADIIKFTFTPVPVKSEDDEEKPQSSQLHQRLTEHVETEADGEDCGGPEPAGNSDSDTHPEPDTVDKTGDASEPETDDSGDWKETREPQSGLNSLKNEVVPVSDTRCSAGEKPFSCSECGKTYGSSRYLKRHMITHTGEKPFSCSVCKKSFTESGDLRKHVRIHTGEKPFSCSVCGKGFRESGNLKKHMRSHTGEKPFSCSVCDKCFADRGKLKVHMRSHTGEKPFSCSVCNKSFTESGVLHTHMRIHTGEKRFSCSVCEQRFTWSSQLKSHLKNHKNQPIQLHQIQTEENREAEPPASSSTEQMTTEADGEDCGGPEPARNPDPDTHPELDTDDKIGCSSEHETDGSDDWKETREPQSGLNCVKNDKTPACDSRHCAGVKPFSCSDCDKRFGTKRNLKEHMRTHTGEKPYICSVCKKSFAQSGTLLIHMRIHTGEKPFSCSVCGKSFAERGRLKRHMRSHTGEKPFSCSVCKKYFSESCSLQKHMRIHTGEKRFSCSVCDERFTWSSQLKKHLKNHKTQSSQCHQTQTEENREAEPPASSLTLQIKTEADEEDCGGTEPAKNSDADTHLQYKTGDSSEPETRVQLET